MRPIAIAVLAVGLVQGPATTRPNEEAFAAGVAETEMRRYVRELVAFGPRMGGTPSNEKSAAYLSAFFKKHGLEVTVQEDPPALAHWEDGWRVTLPDGAAIESAWPFGFSASTNGTREGKLLLVEDLAKAAPTADWHGRVIYTPGDVGRAYAAIVRSGHLPAAILSSAPNDPKRYVDWSRLSSLPAATSHPVPAFSVSYVDGRALASAAAAGRTVRVSLNATIREGRGRTVIATLRGQSPDGYYLVCAHGDSDSGGPGADDNASGVATVMEIARVYASLVRANKLPRPKYSIRFAVWGAEYRSARTFIEREGDRLAQLKGVLNFDETGTGAERDAIYFESNDVPWNEPMLRTFEAVAGDYAGRPGFWTEYTTNPSQGGTDSYAFLPRQYKGTGQTSLQIPSTTIYTAAWDKLAELDQVAGWESKGTPDPKKLKIDYSLYYHSSGDTPENTTEREPQNMVRAARVTGMTLIRLNR
ncbi:MAG TPA: M28 family peptidase [Vicinamibacterales bacterium]|nr:M28 family peptidase [Vicinamibacterales bacterium]